MRSSVVALSVIVALLVGGSLGIRYMKARPSQGLAGLAEEFIPADADETLVNCTLESQVDPEILPALTAELDQAWLDAKTAAGKPNFPGPRPQVCGRDGAPVVIMEGHPGFLCGYYQRETNTILAVYDPETCGSFRCVLVHEFLHAITGSGHKQYPPLMKAAGCER